MTTIKVFDGSIWQTTSLPISAGGATTYVGPEAPPGPLKTGDLWYDTDDVNQLVLPLSVVNGGTGATTAPTARTSLAVPAIGNSTVTAGAPTTGTWARGDQWLDSSNVLWLCTTGGTPGTWMAKNAGEELAYNQITATVNITATSQASPNLVIEGTTRTYDGSPIIVEFNAHTVTAAGAGAQLYFSFWDGATDLGYASGTFCTAGTQLNMPVSVKRRITPTPGSHTYRVFGIATVGSGSTTAGPGGVAQWNPAFIRVTRA